MNFKNRVALVTGAGSKKGIGRETAVVLAEKGANVVVADMNLEGAQEVAEELKKLGAEAIGVQVNVTDEESVAAMVKATMDKFGKIDILINNAGITQPVTIADMTLADFNRVVSVNLTGTFLCSKAVMGIMAKQKYGRIVNTSSVSAKCGGGVFGGAHYCAAKAGVLGFAKTLAKEVVADGITVNSVCPGAISTEIRAGISDEKENQIIQSNPMKRVGTAREVADTIAFLASEEASYITGEDIDINGGSYMD